MSSPDTLGPKLEKQTKTTLKAHLKCDIQPHLHVLIDMQGF